MYTYKGKTALITGASSGIGENFSYALAQRGMNLILVARSEDKLQKMAAEITAQYHVKVAVIAADLIKENATSLVAASVKAQGLQVDMLINNAGFGLHGRFDELDGQLQHQEVMLNVASLLDMTHAFLPDMIARKDGAVINVASTAAFQPIPYMATYGATKAFVLSFTDALWAENRKHGIKVLTLCPGATETAFFATSGEAAAVGKKRTSQQVVVTGLKALEAGRIYVVDGTSNYLTAQLGRFFPRSLTARITLMVTGPKTNKKSDRKSESAV